MNICKEESKTGTSPSLIYNIRTIILYRQKKLFINRYTNKKPKILRTLK